MILNFTSIYSDAGGIYMKKSIIFISIFFASIITFQHFFFLHQIRVIQSDSSFDNQSVSKLIHNEIHNNNLKIDQKIETLSQKVDTYAKAVYDLQNDQLTKPQEEVRIPNYELTIDENHLIHLHNTGSEAVNLTWIITHNGSSPIERAATSDPTFQYDSSTPGIYTLYLKSFYDGSFHTISNVITYELTQEKTGD